ncbi:hypothetical protein A4W76_02430 [Latilactobacillus curvatus]|nr:hypothetical protein A4W76_02430 [Latilactobacillus curvatus]
MEESIRQTTLKFAIIRVYSLVNRKAGNMMPVIYPGQTIGIIGNDQRAYMLALKAKEMGYRVAAIVTRRCKIPHLHV